MWKSESQRLWKKEVSEFSTSCGAVGLMMYYLLKRPKTLNPKP